MDKKGTDYCKLVKIEQTGNGPNNPEPKDETIIEDYIYKTYGDTVDSFGVNIDFMDEEITIGED